MKERCTILQGRPPLPSSFSTLMAPIAVYDCHRSLCLLLLPPCQPHNPFPLPVPSPFLLRYEEGEGGGSDDAGRLLLSSSSSSFRRFHSNVFCREFLLWFPRRPRTPLIESGGKMRISPSSIARLTREEGKTPRVRDRVVLSALFESRVPAPSVLQPPPPPRRPLLDTATTALFFFSSSSTMSEGSSLVHYARQQKSLGAVCFSGAHRVWMKILEDEGGCSFTLLSLSMTRGGRRGMWSGMGISPSSRQKTIAFRCASFLPRGPCDPLLIVERRRRSRRGL